MDESKKRIRYIIIESMLTSGGLGLATPILTEFWNSIGMNQSLIGLSQMVCSIAVLLLTYPMGYVADRYDRRLLNVLGDLGLSFVFLFYVFSKNVYYVIIFEFLCGVFMSMSQGVDSSLLKYYSDKLDKEQGTKDSFKKYNSKLTTLNFISLIVFLIIGMFLAKINIKLNIALVFIPNIIGTIYGLMVPDIGDRLERENDESSIKTLIKTTKKLVDSPKKIIKLISISLTSKVTHPIIWILTPLLIYVGVPVYIVAFGWILNYLTPILGSLFARKFKDCKFSTKFILPFITVGIASIVLIYWTNIYTVWIFGLIGFSRGYYSVLLLPDIQNETPDKLQTSLISLISTICTLIYIPAVYIVNYFGNDNPIRSVKANLWVFYPIALIVYILLRKYDKREAQ